MKNVVIERRCLLTPPAGVSWASEMVLNPSLIIDKKTGRYHMLVRTTGPYPEKQFPGKPLPYPIFMAYGYSDDSGATWQFDFDRPALAPALEYDIDKIWILNDKGEKVPNYTNGCIEDPRMFMIDDECYCTLACRMFPPGPFWEHDDPVQCMPEWAKGSDNPFGTQANPTVTVLFRVNLDALSKKDYDSAFTYVTNLTSVQKGEDRDVFLFPHKMQIDGKLQYVMIHRPYCPYNYDGVTEEKPSVMISAAEDLYSFAENATKRRILLSPQTQWQAEKVGGSTPPVALGDGKWLLNFHGKENDEKGYAQSFMILQEKENDFPEITHICHEKWIVSEADFEMPNKAKIPAVFFTDCERLGDELLVSYGAVDERVCFMRLDLNAIVDELKNYSV